MLVNHYYLPFIPKAKVNYFYLFSLIDIAEYNKATKAFDTINYKSKEELAEKLNVSAGTISNLLKKDSYKDFFSVDTKLKKIILNNSFY